MRSPAPSGSSWTPAGQLADAATRDAEQRAAAAQRQNRRLRWLLGGIAVLLVVAVVVGVIALARATPRAGRDDSAQAKRLAAQSLTEQHPDLALLSAVEAVRTEASPETYGALLTLLARAPRDASGRCTPWTGSCAAAPARTVAPSISPRTYPWCGPSTPTPATRSGRSNLPGQPGRLAAEPHGRGLLTVALGSGGPEVACSTHRTAASYGRSTRPTHRQPARPPGPPVGWLPDGRYLVATAADLLIGDGDTGRVNRHCSLARARSPATRTCCRSGRTAGSASPTPRAPCSSIRRRARWNRSPVPGAVQAVSAAGVLAVVDLTDLSRPVVQLYDATTMTPIGDPFTLPYFSGGIRFSPDGTVLAVGAGNVLQLRDGQTGEPAAELNGHSGAIMDMRLHRPAPGPAVDRRPGRHGHRLGPVRAPRHTANHPRTDHRRPRRHRRHRRHRRRPDPATTTARRRQPGRPTHRGDPPLDAARQGATGEPTAVAITPDGRTALAGITPGT